MLGRRSLIVAIALVLGLAAGGASYAYLHSVQQRAYHNAKLTDVYVAKGIISHGVSGAAAISAGLIVKAQMPQQFRPTSAVTDLATIRNELALADITSGQVISSTLFAPPIVTAGTTAQAIPAGDVAITISVDQVHGVAGLVQPGDQVDLLVQQPNQEALLYQNVPVLAIGSTVVQHGSSSATGTPAAAASSSLVTFAVPLDAAARIAFIESGGGATNFYMALVPPGNQPQPFTNVTPQNLFSAGPTPK